MSPSSKFRNYAKPPSGSHHACVHALLGGFKVADHGVTMEPRVVIETTSRPAGIFTTVVPGHGAGLDVCVASSNGAAARGDAAQAASDRKTSHCRKEIQDLSSVGLDSRWTTTPSCHTNDEICSRHSGLSKRATSVSKRPPTQMDT